MSRRRDRNRRRGRRRDGDVRLARERIRRAPSSDHPHTMPSAETLLAPDLELFATFHIGSLPAEIMPLYAVLIATYHAISGRPDYSVVLASAQLVRALEHLGFEAELVPASIMVVREGRNEVMDIGVWQHPPVLLDDGTTDGHVTIWTRSFSRCIDLGPCNHAELLKYSSESQTLHGPVVLPITGGWEELLHGSPRPAILRQPFMMCWTWIPRWRSYFDPFLVRHASAVEDGGLALARIAVDLLSAIAVDSDMTEFNRLYPWIADLLSERADLPVHGRKSRLYPSRHGQDSI